MLKLKIIIILLFISTCCAITMEPDEVLDLIEKIEKFIQDV